MNFALILAGGIGTRMGSNKPKQFLNLCNKPILIHTIEKFSIGDFEKIIVLIPKEWFNYTKDLLKYYCFNNVVIIEGGELRIDTINKGMEYILENFEEDDNHIVVTHDAVRPFVSHRIIVENIKYAEKYGACDTVVLATDTIVESNNNKIVSNIPIRDCMYQGQTPQSFKLNKLKSFYDNLDENEKIKLTDACKLFILNEEKVYLVKGDISNIKITHPYDLKVANFILGEYND